MDSSVSESNSAGDLENLDSNLDSLDNNPEKTLKKVSTKQRILDCATHLFALKGFTETTIREIATFIGMTEATIYNHFESKNAILEYILEEYASSVSGSFKVQKLYELKGNITADDIISCLTLDFPKDKEEYYVKKLYVILQEQHRNQIVREFVAKHVILNTETVIKTIVYRLKEIGTLRQETDADSFAKVFSSLMYTFANRRLLGIGDDSPDFSGKSMVELIRRVCNIMLKMSADENWQSSDSKPPQ